MATFKSPKVLVSKTAEEFYKKIGNLNNLKEIMPSQIECFESTASSCTFKMKGMPKLYLEIKEKVEHSKISLIARNSQVPLLLDCFITEKGEQCQARLEINAELNTMMKMIVEKPLTQFLDVLASKMQNF